MRFLIVVDIELNREDWGLREKAAIKYFLNRNSAEGDTALVKVKPTHMKGARLLFENKTNLLKFTSSGADSIQKTKSNFTVDSVSQFASIFFFETA